jgi:hypothetical protein
MINAANNLTLMDGGSQSGYSGRKMYVANMRQDAAIAFGDFPAFIAMWINFVVICPVCIAASCLIFATYILRPLYPDCDVL